MAQTGWLDRGRVALLLCAAAVLAGGFALGRALNAPASTPEPVVRVTPLATPAVSVKAPPSLSTIGPLPRRPHHKPKPKPKPTPAPSGGGSGSSPPPVGGAGNL